MLSSEAHSTTYVDAEAPFHATAPKADIILRSSDNVDLHFSKALLVYSSSFFENLLADATPDELKGGRPIVSLPDESADLRRLLSLCHPSFTLGTFQNINEVIALYELSCKYCMEDCVSALESTVLRSPLVLASPPLVLFASAARFKLPNMAQYAAKKSLDMTLHELIGDRAFGPHLRQVSAQSFHQLFRYHKECGIAASKWIHLLVDQTNTICMGHGTSYCEGLDFGSDTGVVSVHPGVKQFSEQLGDLLRMRPSVISVQEATKIIDALGQTLRSCSYCQNGGGIPNPAARLAHFMSAVCLKVQEQIDQVQFEIDF